MREETSDRREISREDSNKSLERKPEEVDKKEHVDREETEIPRTHKDRQTDKIQSSLFDESAKADVLQLVLDLASDADEIEELADIGETIVELQLGVDLTVDMEKVPLPNLLARENISEM